MPYIIYAFRPPNQKYLTRIIPTISLRPIPDKMIFDIGIDTKEFYFYSLKLDESSSINGKRVFEAKCYIAKN